MRPRPEGFGRRYRDAAPMVGFAAAYWSLMGPPIVPDDGLLAEIGAAIQSASERTWVAAVAIQRYLTLSPAERRTAFKMTVPKKSQAALNRHGAALIETAHALYPVLRPGTLRMDEEADLVRAEERTAAPGSYPEQDEGDEE